MHLQTILQLSAVVAAVILFLEFLVQIYRFRHGQKVVHHGLVFLNWLLIVVIIVGLGGGGYLSYQQSKASAHRVPKHQVVHHPHTQRLVLKFENQVQLDQDGEQKVEFTVSPQTKLKIVGHYSHQVYKSFSTKPSQHLVKEHYTFTGSGTYDIIATRGHKRVKKQLTVKSAEVVSSSSSSVISSSSSTSSSSSSSSSSQTSSSSSISSQTNSSYQGNGASQNTRVSSANSVNQNQTPANRNNGQ